MTREASRFHLDVILDPDARLRTMGEDVRRGLLASPKSLSSKYFYDSVGSALFQEITNLPEYYCTRAETEILERVGALIMGANQPLEIVELGCGAPAKISLLLDTPAGRDITCCYFPMDVDRGALSEYLDSVAERFPLLQGHGIVGDFEHHLELLPKATGRRLVVFFGSTIGNLHAPERQELLTKVRRLLEPSGQFLLGVDLVKDKTAMHRAYNDSAGVTAAFNRNMLYAINKALHADFQPPAYMHKAFYNEEMSRMEMHLVPKTPQTVHVRDVDLTVEIGPKESIWTESSYKFTRKSCEAMLRDAGLKIDTWHTDSKAQFALMLASPAAEVVQGR